MLSAQEFTLADDKAGKAFKAATKAVGLGDANARSTHVGVGGQRRAGGPFGPAGPQAQADA